MYSGTPAVDDPNVDPVRQQVLKKLKAGQSLPQAGIPEPTDTPPPPPAPPQGRSFSTANTSPFGEPVTNAPRVPQPGDPDYVGAPAYPPTTPGAQPGGPVTLPPTPPAPTPGAGGGFTPAPGTPTIGSGTADLSSIVKNYGNANNYLGQFLNSAAAKGTSPQMWVDLANKAFNLQSGSGAQYYAAGTHGAGSAETIGLPGGYFAHENNDPNAPWHWVPSNEGAGGSATSNSFLQSIRQMLTDRMTRDLSPVNPNDPEIADPFNAARNTSDRTLDFTRKANAEAAFAQSGGGSIDRNELNMQQQQAIEHSGINLSNIKSSLVAKLYQAKRADLDAAMQQALASGDAEMARQIQLAISQLNAQVTREGYGVQLAMSTANQNAATTAAGG